MEKIIVYFGQKAKIACDEKCNKAWGIIDRPRIYPDISETKTFGLIEDERVHVNYKDEKLDLNNYIYCSDEELGDAPEDPGTYEGWHGKPTNESEIGNKWCVRQCERCSMSKIGQYDNPIELKDFSKRISNK